MFKGFEIKEIEEHQKNYAEEVRQTYPNDLVTQSEQRTSQYTAQIGKELEKKQMIFTSYCNSYESRPS
ncbi:hypothetical protein [Pontibacillus yanchengensis]|nr:hypothetical protein [Pontibacillus yanchengensis]